MEIDGHDPAGCAERGLRNCFRAGALGIFTTIGGALPSVLAQDETVILERGREVFLEVAEPECSVCHSLSDAGAEGDVGPDLDELKPSTEQVRKAVVEGIEAMPEYEGTLSGEEIEAVSRYVSSVAGR